MINRKLMSLLPDSKKYIGQTVLFNWIAMLANVLIIWQFSNTIEKIRQNTLNTRSMVVVVSIVAAGIGIRMICQKLAARSSYQASKDVKLTLRDKIYHKLLRLGNSYQEKLHTSELVQVSMEGVEQLEIYFGKYMPQFFYSLLAPISLFVILAPISLKTAGVLLLCVILIPVSIVAVQKIAKKLLSKYWNSYTGLGNSFLENLQGLTTLKIYQADERKTKEMDIEAENFRKVTMKVLMMQLNSISVMDLAAFGGAALGILIGIFEYQRGNVGFAGMLIILLLSSEFFIPMRLLGSFFHVAMNGIAASDKIFNILEMEEVPEGTETIKEMASISINHVDFSYDASRKILKDITMEIPAKKFIAIAGASGCGKSTIAGILTKKNKEYSGEISIGGQNFYHIREEELLKNVTLVTHNGYLFTGTVMDNLKMGKADATKDEMISVLKKVNLYEFLMQQEGLETMLSEQAGNLSGGQRQRLVLARALLRDTPVYIFDEATSNIDVESETEIIKLIHEMKHEKTIIIISHRLENLVPADQIYYIEKGRIMEKGTHKQLLDVGGGYKKLYEVQKQLERFTEVEHA